MFPWFLWPALWVTWAPRFQWPAGGDVHYGDWTNSLLAMERVNGALSRMVEDCETMLDYDTQADAKSARSVGDLKSRLKASGKDVELLKAFLTLTEKQ